MSEPTTQTPGNLPPGMTLDSMLTVEETALWLGLSVRTVQDQVRNRRIPSLDGSQNQPRRIHPRTVLAKRSPEFRKFLATTR